MAHTKFNDVNRVPSGADEISIRYIATLFSTRRSWFEISIRGNAIVCSENPPGVTIEEFDDDTSSLFYE
jgi:hypothetical protein